MSQYWGIFLWLVVLSIPWIVLGCDELRTRRMRRRQVLFSRHWDAGQSLVEQKKWAEALEELGQALALVDANPAREPYLRFQTGYVLEEMGKLEEAIEAYKACQTPGWITRDRSCHSAALRQAALLSRSQRWAEAELCLHTVVKEARRQGEHTLQSNALHMLMGIYQTMRKPDKVLDVTGRLFQLARAEGDEAKQALLLDVEGDANLVLGKPDEALDRYECSLDLLRRLGSLESARIVEQDIARLYQMSGEWEKAVRWLDILLRKEELVSNHSASGRIAYDLACLHIHTGELQQAASYLQQSLGRYRQAEDRAGADLVGRTLVGLGILLHRDATANWLTFADIKRGSAKSNQGEE